MHILDNQTETRKANLISLCAFTPLTLISSFMLHNYSGVYRTRTLLMFSISISGHGSSPTIPGSDSASKPISGPRMPDGTRGFTMGRGRLLPLPEAEKAQKTEE
uniref:Uncharacterized protein n=1 Tax=Aegilops tauschii subsp. strangulata TaxID=200361 RepID=A0A453FJ65_AEGTS